MSAAPTYWRMPEKIRNEMYEGCGPGHLGDYVVPDTLWGLCITECCRIHDHDYEIGETVKDKKKADLRLLRNISALVYRNTKGKIWRKARMRRAFLYYKMVKRYGHDSFWKNKDRR